MRLINRKHVVVFSIALPLYFLFSSIALAQTTPADTVFLQSARQHALVAYEKAIGVHTHLYNGTEYADYKKAHVEGDQFLMSKAVSTGSIYYDGTWYTQVPMLYDLVTDEVIVPHNSSGLLMKLIKEKVDTFQLHGHTFVHYKANNANSALPQPGFYDLLYNRDIQLLARRSKNIQERATSDGMEGEFRVGDKFYIRKDGHFHQVSSKKSVYKVLKDKKKQLQKHASSQRLRFRKKKEEAILTLVRYYDSLPAEQAEQ